MVRWRFSGMFVLLTTLMQACASSPNVIPPNIESQVDEHLRFTQLIRTPNDYTGKVILIGGEVLHAKGLATGTQLEILQLPLDEWQRPQSLRTASEGRFLALKNEFLDPATIPQNTQVTLVGEIVGSQIASLDETEYQYPTLVIKHLHIWKQDSYASQQPSQPRWSIFGGGGTGIRTGGGVSIGIGF